MTTRRSMVTGDFPFPIIWQLPLNLNFTPRHRCLVAGDSVSVRCGDWIINVATSDGVERWRLALEPAGGGGTFFLAASGVLLTDFTLPAERLSSVLAIRKDGRPLWRTDPPAIVMAGAAAAETSVFIPAIEPGAGSVVCQINVADGHVIRLLRLPWGAHGLLPLGSSLVVRNQVIRESAPGIYTVSLEDEQRRALLEESAWTLARNVDTIAIVTRSSLDSPRRLHVLDAASLSIRWENRALANETAALDDDAVFTTIVDGGMHFLVALETGSGAVRWRTGPLDGPAMQLYVADPVILTRSLGVNRLYRRSDGAPLATFTGIVGGPVAHEGRLYLFVEETLVCASADLSSM